MASYSYIAKARDGQEVNGLLAGASIDEIVAQLHADGLSVLHVAPAAERKTLKKRLQEFGSMTFGTASTAELALFSRQLATVLESGIPLVRGLRGLSCESTKASSTRPSPIWRSGSRRAKACPRPWRPTRAPSTRCI